MNITRASICSTWLLVLGVACGDTQNDGSNDGVTTGDPSATGPTAPGGTDGVTSGDPTGGASPTLPGPPGVGSGAGPDNGPGIGVGPTASAPGAGVGPTAAGPATQTPTDTPITNPPPGAGGAPNVPTPVAAGGDTSGEAGGPSVPAPEPEPVIRPSLVTSGQNAYWVEGELTEASGSAQVSVDTGTTYQEWLGMGGTFNEAGWDALSVIDPAERDRAVRLLFDAAEGANFAWGRFPIGASDYAMDRYSLDDHDGDYEMASFSIDRDKMMLIPFIEAALDVNPDLRLWASPWSPPAWMKVSGNMNGLVNDSDSGARIKNEAPVLTAYALYFARFIEEYAKIGIEVESIQPQNEPGYATRYPSCLWTPELLRDFVRDYLGPTLEEHSLDTEIWLGTMSAPEDTQHVQTLMSDANAAKYIKGIGLQWNTMGSVGTYASQYQVPVMQTEHKCGNYPWESASFNADRPPNDHAYAVESWGYIRDWIKAGVASYSAWNMVLDTKGQNLDVERPWPQNALLTVDRGTKALTETPAYYVFRHVSYFVDPGAMRVATTGNADALAFENPDGSQVAILHNSGGSDQQTTLGIGGKTVQFSIPARGWATAFWKAE